MTPQISAQSTPLSASKCLTVRDGAEISYRLLSGAGPVRFALIHSLAMDHRFWARAAKRLRAAGDVLLFDCRGHGASSGINSPSTAEQFAGDLADLFDATGWDDAIVAGASMGGCVALAFAAAHPGRVRGLGLADTTAWYDGMAPQHREERAQKALDSGMAALADYATPLATAEAMREAIPGATLEVLASAAHLTPLERPKDVARGLLELAEAAR